MTKFVAPIPDFNPEDIVGWATSLLSWYELFLNRIKNVQLNYCNKCEAKFAAFYPSQFDHNIRWNMFIGSPWWQRFDRLVQRLQFDFNQFMKICLDLSIPIPPFQCLRNGSIIPSPTGFTTINHQCQFAPSPPILRKILSDHFHI